MDEELRQYLDGMEERTASRIGSLRAELQTDLAKTEERLVTLMDSRLGGLRAELQTDLAKTEERLVSLMDSRFGGVQTDLAKTEERIVSLMASEVGSLHNELQSEMGQVKASLARVEDRLDRQAMMLAGGTKALGGLLEHVVSLDSNYSRVMDEMHALRARIDRLERKAS
jgi:chromosome segregation ATPase